MEMKLIMRFWFHEINHQLKFFSVLPLLQFILASICFSNKSVSIKYKKDSTISLQISSKASQIRFPGPKTKQWSGGIINKRFKLPAVVKTFSHLSSNYSKTTILLLTLEPPTIAAKGRWGESIAPCKYWSSFCIK